MGGLPETLNDAKVAHESVLEARVENQFYSGVDVVLLNVWGWWVMWQAGDLFGLLFLWWKTLG